MFLFSKYILSTKSLKWVNNLSHPHTHTHIHTHLRRHHSIYKLFKFFRKIKTRRIKWNFVFFFLNLLIHQTLLIIPIGYRPILQVNALCGGLMNFTTIAALRTFLFWVVVGIKIVLINLNTAQNSCKFIHVTSLHAYIKLMRLSQGSLKSYIIEIIELLLRKDFSNDIQNFKEHCFHQMK